MKVLIVGAGVAGLATGWRLAQAGASVEIFDRGLAGHGATWASAGMLAPGAELGPDASPLARFAHESRAAWPAFAADLEAASGVELGYREDGSLLVAWDERAARDLKQRAARLNAHGMEATWFPATDVIRRESLLSSDVGGALFVAGDAQVDSRALGEALRAALIRLNVRIRESCGVEALVVDGRTTKGIVTPEGKVLGDRVVLATGAWLNGIGGVPKGLLPEVKPIKGQMASVLPPKGVALPRALVWDEEVYLVPRRDRLLIGATVEDVGFDTSVTAEARERLVGAAARLLRGFNGWGLAELWAGLRPKASDEAPVLGETEIAGLWVAGGQYRNGILFAPLLAQRICAALLNQGAGHPGVRSKAIPRPLSDPLAGIQKGE
jgi:glycine oxidase